MAIILREPAHTHDAMQRARWFIAVARAKLGHAQRQVPIAFQTLIIDLHMARAVHGLERVDGFFARVILVNFDDEHILLVFFPVTRRFPQFAVHNLRRIYLDIAARILLATHVILQLGVNPPAVGMPEHLTGGLFLHMEQVHFTTQFAVIALGGLFQHMQVLFQVIAVLEGHAIDALQHRVLAVAAPIGTRHIHQLERVTGHLAGMLEMRTTAQILPIPVPIHADGLAIIGDRMHQLDLVGFARFLIMGDGVGARPDLSAHNIAGIDDLFHLFLDRTQIFGCERLGAVKVIIPTVFDHRPDGHFRVRPQFLHRARHDMGGIMADQFQRLCVIGHGMNGNLGIRFDRPLQIMVHTIDGGRNGFLAK